MNKSSRKKIIIILVLILLAIGVAAGCYSCARRQAAEEPVTEEPSPTPEPTPEEPTEPAEPPLEYVAFDPDQAYSYLSDIYCGFSNHGALFLYEASFDKAPESDDNLVYIFAFEMYEDETDFSKGPLTTMEKAHSMRAELDPDYYQLFEQFIPALLVDGEYVPIAEGRYADNIGAIAGNQSDFPTYTSKKGLLIDVNMVGTDKLTDLNLTHAEFNMPISFFLGTEEEASTTPMVTFDYQGQTYYFKEQSLLNYDALFSSFTNSGYVTTAILLNDMNENHMELIHPKSRTKTSKSKYYMFNTTDEEGAKALQAAILFLSERYTDGEHGMVHNWVIANEINQHTDWNYMDTTDLEEYVTAFEHSFRTCYNAIKSNYAAARVYFSIDKEWNSNGGTNEKFFNSKELVTTFARMASEKGNYDWSLAIHPYPINLGRVTFWNHSYNHTADAQKLTFMNLNVLTDYMEQEELLNPDGNVRHIAVTELGFTSSTKGEKMQAIAYAYCYRILEDNPYIDMFLLNRQTDALSEMKEQLAYGLYNHDGSPKYIVEVFAGIDGPDSHQYDQMILNAVGVGSMDEALALAKP